MEKFEEFKEVVEISMYNFLEIDVRVRVSGVGVRGGRSVAGLGFV